MTSKRMLTFFRAARVFAVACFFNLFLAVTAWAAEGDELTQSGFRPASDIEKDTVDGGLLLIAAYAVAWLLVAGYVFIVAKRSREAATELDSVRLLARDLEVRLDEEDAAR